MKAFVEKENKELSFKSLNTKDMLKELGISSEEVLVCVNGNLVLGEHIFSKGDEVKILSVVSGG